MREKGCAGCSMRGKRLDQFIQTFHEHGKRQQWHERKIIFTLGVIPVPSLVIHGLQNFISRFQKCKLTHDRVQITFIRTGERESIQLFIIYTAVCIHSRTNVFFVAITVLKTIQAWPRKVALDSFSLDNILLSIVNIESKLSSCSRAPLIVYLSAMLKFFSTYEFLCIGPK